MNDQQRAAMQMALEALETLIGLPETEDWLVTLKESVSKSKPAITALREALAQPQDKSDVEHYRAIKKRNAEVVALEKAQPQGEPVVSERQLKIAMRQWERWKQYAFELQERLVKYEGGSGMILNTTPPVVPQGEPVAGSPSWEAFDIAIQAAIEATKEKAAKVCENLASKYCRNDAAIECAAAIRSMK